YCSLTKREQQVVSEPKLVDKKGGSYAVIAPKLEQGKFNKWKKRMLYYLAGMEPYYLKCIKGGPFQPKTADDDAKPKSQWTLDKRRVVVQAQRIKRIIMSCLPYDIMKSVISCISAKETWTDLVHSFEGPSDTKENIIMDLKLEYQTFRAKSIESLSLTYTRYKTLLNELANDGVNLSKHEINVGFMNSLLEKWLTFSQGLGNANHTQTLDLADIYGRYGELITIYTQHGLKMDESISVSSIIDKLPHSWKDFKHTLKHGKDNLSLVQLGSFTCSMRIYMDGKDSDKGKGFSDYNILLLVLINALDRRSKVTPIENHKDLSSLVLDELIGNLKVHEVVMEKDSEIYRGKKKRVKSIAFKAKKESSDDETSTSESDDEEYVMAVRNFKKFFRRKGKFVRQPREEKKSFRQRDKKKAKSDRK
ncbi:hypothetical protein Tco_0762578, partial [Tanacetum coccineum]